MKGFQATLVSDGRMNARVDKHESIASSPAKARGPKDVTTFSGFYCRKLDRFLRNKER